MFRRFLPLPPMTLFAMATLTPLALLGAGVWLGGAWVLPGLLYMAVLTIALDRLIRWTAPDAPEGAEFPAADALLIAIGVAHLIAFPVAVWAIAGESGLSPLARIGLFAGFGLVFGQVSNPAAHELNSSGQPLALSAWRRGLCNNAERPSRIGTPAGASPACGDTDGPQLGA